MEHNQFCNCEDCWSRGQKEVCSTCGCVVGEGCPCDNDYFLCPHCGENFNTSTEMSNHIFNEHPNEDFTDF